MCTSSPGSKLDITLTDLPRPHQDDQKQFLRKKHKSAGTLPKTGRTGKDLAEPKVEVNTEAWKADASVR